MAAFVSLLIALYALGILGEIDKSSLLQRLIKFRLFGGFLIGLIFGLVSTPCASAPLFAIITIAANSSALYAYGLILTFALGHSLLLLIAGVSLGFTQKILSSSRLTKFSNLLNKFFAFALIFFACYFIWQALLQL